MTDCESLSFANDIRPKFRNSDINTMRPRGLDLADHAVVSARAEDIYARLAAGDMPCDMPWVEEDVALFKRWMDGGRLP